MSLTARELIHKLATDSGLPYREVATEVNKRMADGSALVEVVKAIATEQGLDIDHYSIDTKGIVREAISILEEDYTQTLMISAVLAKMVESKGKDHLPLPAFFAFMDILSRIDEAHEDRKSETSKEIDTHTTRMIELMTTLVSVVCAWSAEGITGISSDCPKDLVELATQVHWKTKMFQSGVWSCISCGKMVDFKDTRALMCMECDSKLTSELADLHPDPPARDRIGYGRTQDESETE